MSGPHFAIKKLLSSFFSNLSEKLFNKNLLKCLERVNLTKLYCCTPKKKLPPFSNFLMVLWISVYVDLQCSCWVKIFNEIKTVGEKFFCVYFFWTKMAKKSIENWWKTGNTDLNGLKVKDSTPRTQINLCLTFYFLISFCVFEKILGYALN